MEEKEDTIELEFKKELDKLDKKEDTVELGFKKELEELDKKKEKKKKKFPIWIIIVLAILILLVGGYFGYSKVTKTNYLKDLYKKIVNKEEKPNPTPTPEPDNDEKNVACENDLMERLSYLVDSTNKSQVDMNLLKYIVYVPQNSYLNNNKITISDIDDKEIIKNSMYATIVFSCEKFSNLIFEENSELDEQRIYVLKETILDYINKGYNKQTDQFLNKLPNELSADSGGEVYYAIDENNSNRYEFFTYANYIPSEAIDSNIRKVYKTEVTDKNMYIYMETYNLVYGDGYNYLYDRFDMKNAKIIAVECWYGKCDNEEYTGEDIDSNITPVGTLDINKYPEAVYKYKHTFNKRDDGTYYWYSTELIKE